MNCNKRTKLTLEDFEKEIIVTIKELENDPSSLFDEWPIDIKHQRTGRPWYDIYAEKLIKIKEGAKEYFERIESFSREETGKPYNQNHEGIQEKKTKSIEDIESKSFFNFHQKYGQDSSDFFLFDYQMPMKRKRQDDGVGKVDLIGCDDKNVYLLENKRIFNPNGHILHAIIEIYTYYRFLFDSLDVLSKEYPEYVSTQKKLVPALIYYRDSVTFKEFHDKNAPYIRKLMDELGVVSFVVIYDGDQYKTDEEAITIEGNKVYPSRKITIKRDKYTD